MRVTPHAPRVALLARRAAHSHQFTAHFKVKRPYSSIRLQITNRKAYRHNQRLLLFNCEILGQKKAVQRTAMFSCLEKINLKLRF
jgi:hypothetical protein